MAHKILRIGVVGGATTTFAARIDQSKGIETRKGARRAAVRYDLGRATVPVLAGFAIVAAISVGIPIGKLIDWFSRSSDAALSGAAGNLRYLLPEIPAIPHSSLSLLLQLCFCHFSHLFFFFLKAADFSGAFKIVASN